MVKVYGSPITLGLGAGIVLFGLGAGLGQMRGCLGPSDSYYDAQVEAIKVQSDARAQVETQRTRTIEELARKYGDKMSPEEFQAMISEYDLGRGKRHVSAQ
jgi:hypothetical protein